MTLPEFLAPKTTTLRTTESAPACAERLRQAIDGDFAIFGSKPVIGSVGQSSASLRVRKTFRNSFQTILQVTLEDQAGGARIIAKSGVSVFVLIFLALWFGVLGLSLIGMADNLFRPGGGGIGFIGLGIPLVMLAFPVAMLVFGRWLARNEHQTLVDFIARVTDAQPVADGLTGQTGQRRTVNIVE